MTKITSALAVALLASASFASVALADGDYYEGASKAASQVSSSQARDGVSYGYTGSISNHRNNQGANDVVIGRGDYYDGANRPN